MRISDWSSACALPIYHEVVVGALGDLQPAVLVAAERHHRLVDLLEVGVLRRDLVKGFVGSLETGFQHLERALPQLGAAGNQLAHISRVQAIVAGPHVVLGGRGRRGDASLVPQIGRPYGLTRGWMN